MRKYEVFYYPTDFDIPVSLGFVWMSGKTEEDAVAFPDEELYGYSYVAEEDERLKESVRLLNIFATHYVTCHQCSCAFAELRDMDYCETGKPLFQSWREYHIQPSLEMLWNQIIKITDEMAEDFRLGTYTK